MSGWQPIETAPKNSGATLLVCTEHSYVTVGFFRDGRLLNLSGQRPFVDKPTHWMPLPEPPK